MKNYFLIIVIFFFISNCNLNKVVKHHGVHFLEKKESKLRLLETNKNDILGLLGPPSTKSSFDNDIWIYIERKTTTSSIKKLGRKEILVNNVLILEINSKGILTKKDFLNKDNLKDFEISTKKTLVNRNKQSFLDKTLNSLRQKINDPLGKQKVK
tara:strand:- start:428 stop:892 length:465 start_codon:yes stop_codon:yes gene_type:complete